MTLASRSVALPRRLYAQQGLYLLLSALLFLWFSRDGRLDTWLTAPWFDAATGHFPLQNNIWLEWLNHRLSKVVIIASALLALVVGLKSGQRRLLWVVALMACSALVVSLLKANSGHSCPWDLAAYGGGGQSYPLLSALVGNAGPGHCFPGGHASVGFILMAWFFWFYPERPRLAWCCWWLAVAAGFLLGYGQLVRGAHFMTHNLWSGWWVWATQLLMCGLLDVTKDKFQSSAWSARSSAWVKAPSHSKTQ